MELPSFEVHILRIKCMTIKIFQVFIVDVDGSNDTIKVIEDAWWGILK